MLSFRLRKEAACATIGFALGDGATAAQQTLDLHIGVRVPVPQSRAIKTRLSAGFFILAQKYLVSYLTVVLSLVTMLLQM